MTAEDYEPKWVKHYRNGEYYAALDCMILWGEGTEAQMNAISSLLIAQSVGHLSEKLGKK